jgi:hypothetical protein
MKQDGENLILTPVEAAASGYDVIVPLTSAPPMYKDVCAKALAVAATADELSTSPIRGDKSRANQLREESQVLGGLATQLGNLVDPKGMREDAAIEAFRQSFLRNL